MMLPVEVGVLNPLIYDKYAPDTFTVPPKGLDKSTIQPEPRKYSSDAVDRIAAKITGGTVQTSEQEGVEALGFAQRMAQKN